MKTFLLLMVLGLVAMFACQKQTPSNEIYLIRQLDALDSGDVAVIPCNQYSQLLSILKNGENDEKISIGNRTFDLVIEKNRYYLSGDLYDIEIPIVDTLGQMSLKKTWIVEDEN
jgi:hypothetical protein